MKQNKKAEHPNRREEDFILDDDFLSELDVAFDALEETGEKTPNKGESSVSRQEMDTYQMQSTYLAVTQLHLKPVLRYLKAIEKGVASKDLCELVYFVVSPLVGKTQSVGLDEHSKALDDFQKALKTVVKARSRRITHDQKERLMETFAPVHMMFGLEFRGHASAVVNLLGFFRSLRRKKAFGDADLKKLFGIGIPSLSMLRKTSLKELESLSGLSADKVQILRKSAREFSILSLV